MSNLKDNLWKWKEGRQGSGYQKFLVLASYFPIPFDLYILKYETGTFIAPHTDKVENGNHYRLNIILKTPTKGGKFRCQKTIFSSKHIKFFRPDLNEHSVDKIESGRRFVLSLGFVLKSKGKIKPAN